MFIIAHLGEHNNNKIINVFSLIKKIVTIAQFWSLFYVNSDIYIYSSGEFSNTGKCNIYKPMDEWWLIDSDDFIKQIADPVIEKVSANRIKYVFSMADP